MSAIDEAKEYLATALAKGPRPAGELKQWANDQGIKDTTLKRAKKAISVVAKRDGKGWTWSLPEDGHQEDEDDQVTDQVDHTAEDGQSTGQPEGENSGTGHVDEDDHQPDQEVQPDVQDDQLTDQHGQSAEEGGHQLNSHSPENAIERTDTTAVAHFHDGQDFGQAVVASERSDSTATAHFPDDDRLFDGDEGDDLESNDHIQDDDGDVEDEYLDEDSDWYGQGEPDTAVKQNLGIIDFTLAAATGGVVGVCIGIYAEYWGLL